MNNNSYDDFKNGIKKDIGSLGINLVVILGFFTFIFTLFSILGYAFYKPNNFSGTTKIFTATPVLALIVAMFSSKKVGNFVFVVWGWFFLAVLTLIFFGIVFGFLYLISKSMLQDFI
jgi:hypothetical protein